MKPNQRKAASIDLTKTFFNSYFAEWRLTKILATKKLIDQRYDFFTDILPQIRNFESHDLEATIAQEIHNGLHHDAIAQCIQYTEDLFALISATKQPDFFIRNIITYKAGTVTESIKKYKANRKNVIQDFFIPQDFLEVAEDQQGIIDALDMLVEFVRDQITFYDRYSFFYNQYKHGLSVPLRSLGTSYDEEQVKEDKQGDMPPFIVVYDNLNLTAADKKGTLDPKNGIMIPGFTDNVRPVVSNLMTENNFLRLVYPFDTSKFNIDTIIEHAYKTRTCINVIAGNFIKHIDPTPGHFEFQLPDIDYKMNNAINCSYDSVI